MFRWMPRHMEEARMPRDGDSNLPTNIRTLRPKITNHHPKDTADRRNRANEIREFCDARRTDGSGNRCRRKAGAGTTHYGRGYCENHGGNTPAQKKSAVTAEIRETIEEQTRKGMGAWLRIDPAEALLQEVWRTAGHIHFIEEQIAEWGYKNPREVLLQFDLDLGYEKAAWWRVYQEERAHLARVSKLALDAGIDARLVALAEQQVEQVNMLLIGVFQDLGIDTGDPHVRQVVAARLLQLTG